MLDFSELNAWRKLWLLLSSIWACLIMMIGLMTPGMVTTLNDLAILLVTAAVPPTFIYLAVLTVLRLNDESRRNQPGATSAVAQPKTKPKS